MMKSKINIVLDILVSWTNRAEVKKYKSMIHDNNKLISQAENVIEKQKVIVEKGRLIKNDKATYSTIRKNVDYENAVNVKAKVEILKADLNTINGIYDGLINAHSKRLRTKQDIITDADKKILNTKNNMLNVTGGLSPKEFIYKYLPKELQQTASIILYFDNDFMKVIDSSGIKKKAASLMWNINVSLLDTVRGYEVNASSIKLHKNI